MLWKIAHHQKVTIQSQEELVNQLLKNRNLTDKKLIDQFFNPNLSDYKSELELPGITKAIKRIQQSINKNELIVVYGDYDVDGVCACAVAYHALTSLGAKVLPYIPHREKEGYGLSKFGLDTVKEKGAKLVITADNGIVAYGQANYAKKIGLDLIVTDHHVKGNKKLNCLATVHSTNLCGTGVIWCLVRKMIGEKEAEELLDFVAVATICDLMPLLGVNRSLVKAGFDVLKKNEKVGWQALFEECEISPKTISSFQVGFMIGPRLNASGRLEHAIDSLRLLCTKDLKKAKELARLICRMNDQKKSLISQAILEAKAQIEQKKLFEKKVLILYSTSWIPGIVGLVASRISEEYRLPAIAISQGEFESKGSARTVDGLNIIETIRQCQDLLIDVGGHPQAAGFTIRTKDILAFSDKLEIILSNTIFEKERSINIEAMVNMEKISKSWVNTIARFEPFGIENPKPTLGSMSIPISNIKMVGNGNHLKFKAGIIGAIAFSMGPRAKDLQEGQLVNLAYGLDIDDFSGYEKVQLKILDITTSK